MSFRSILLATTIAAFAVAPASAHSGGGGSHSIAAPSVSHVLASAYANTTRPTSQSAGTSNRSGGPAPTASGPRPVKPAGAAPQAPRVTHAPWKRVTGGVTSGAIYGTSTLHGTPKLNTPLPQEEGGPKPTQAGSHPGNAGSATNPATQTTGAPAAQPAGGATNPAPATKSKADAQSE
jgi:hypothetical protein